MSTSQRLKRVLTPLLLLLLCLPLSIFLTLLLSPFWRWLEATFEVESFGHSGPAEWCYLLGYITLIVVVFGIRRSLKALPKIPRR